MKPTLFTVAGGLALGASARAMEYAEDIFFIVSHGLLTATRLDPIMSPGDISGHVHAIVGGSNFGPLYDYDRSIESQCVGRRGTMNSWPSTFGWCTTANIAVDHSNYWMPQLYNKHTNGTVSVAGLSYVNTQEDEPTYEFPPGFRMLAGDPDRRTIDLDDPAQDAVRYVCLGGTTPEGHVFPPEQCKDGMRAQIYFPHCWDGINSWLEGSKHVAYGEGRFDGGGKCPPTHPKRIMGLFYEFIFHDHETYRAGGRTWSNGDDVGYSLHADFTNGWPVGFFSEIFSYGRQCSVGFENKDCPALAPHVVDNQRCQYTGVKVNEDIGDQGAIAKLPGNNPPAANYQERAGFNSGSPSATVIASVPATSVVMATVKGDTPQSAPPDAIPQAGQTGTPSEPTRASVSAAPTAIGVPAAPSRASSAAASMPGGGGALIGEPSASSVPISSVFDPYDQSSPPSSTNVASLALPTASSASSVPSGPAPAASNGSSRRPKSCGRKKHRPAI